jgi:hypothetical protein
MLAAALLTAIVGAIENWLYEFFFAPELYSAGPPLGRAAFVVAFSFPFVLGALLILGLPTAFVLRRAKIDSMFSYAIAGVILGACWGRLFGAVTPLGLTVTASYGCCCALLWYWLRPRGLAA